MYVDPNIGAILLQGLAAIVLGAVYRFRKGLSFKWLRKSPAAKPRKDQTTGQDP